MKKIILIFSMIFIAFGVFAQPDGYTQAYIIKQPYHTYNATKYQETKKAFQKVNGLKLSESGKYLVISYAYNPTHIVIYEIGTWEQKGVYKVMGAGVELNSSYFADNDKVMYVKYDRYSTKYKRIEFETGYIRKVPCRKTPKGCVYEEVRQEQKEAMTSNRKFYIEASKFDPSDVIVYIKKTR